MDMKFSFGLLTGIFFFQLVIQGQVTTPTAKPQRAESQFRRLASEDSTLTSSEPPVIMPFNRLIDPAGTAVRFGNPALENHSLDAALLPDGHSVAVEDRYGVVILDIHSHDQLARFTFFDSLAYRGLMSTFSGIKVVRFHDSTYLFWSAAKRDNPESCVIEASWDGTDVKPICKFHFVAAPGADLALPNELEVRLEHGSLFLYVVLNGNDSLQKISVTDQRVIWSCPTGVAPYGITMAQDHVYVTNWGGPIPDSSTHLETAGVPWGSAYIDPATGAISRGTVTIVDRVTGNPLKEINVGLHPNAIIHSPDEHFVYVANGNSDNISVINTQSNAVVDSVSVSIFQAPGTYIGSTPNALALDRTGTTLYVANGMDNAVAVVGITPNSSKTNTPKFQVKGYIPTEAYPSGILLLGNTMLVTNLEAIGARVSSRLINRESSQAIFVPKGDAYTAHRELASVSFIPLPNDQELDAYTKRVKELNLAFRERLSRQLPRPGVAPKPMPERIGEPSVFKHVLYIIKENRTYDQVFGDMSEGRGDPSLCIYGDSATPNQHQMARDFCLLDNYYASGKSSAEGHQWTDASMVTDYIEKSVRAWFRSYPHAQYDAMVYDKQGFIWNNALDHGKTVRIYGEACRTQMDSGLNWTRIYELYQKKVPLDCKNITTISRVRPILSQNYPGYDDPRINDQLRADAFIAELSESDKQAGDHWPQLMVMALPNDHNAGLTPGYPTPRAMVADNDLALARIVEAVSKSRFWKSTVIFVTEDDSQSGWDHISAYRTTGFVISPYSRLKKTIHTQFNQTSMVRSIEQVLGIPPMNGLDATALPMFDCFNLPRDDAFSYSAIPNRIALNEMNRPLADLKGKALHLAKLSISGHFYKIDEGDEELFNKVLWFAAKGNTPYPGRFVGQDKD
jgi:YVTN family beta-propeller protein